MRHPAYQLKPFRTDAGARFIPIGSSPGTLKHEFIPDFSLTLLTSWKKRTYPPYQMGRWHAG
jgi:hypothetical protein